ncbi:MAG: MFS transporter [Holosporaceae bacterium]|jgi:PAT family beta-lactamase induction signal transducer AmpG|nr:MFS transporter [Holosporaceae bacterium]
MKEYFQKCGIGFSYGFSFPLTLVVLDFWLKDAGVSNTTIGLFTLLHWPFTLKLVWGICIENYKIPYFSDKIGNIRSWIIISHIILIAGVVGMAYSDPGSGLGRLIFFAALTAFGDGCKSIILYPYQIHRSADNQLGYVAGVVGLGHKIGMITVKVLTLHLAYFLSWKTAYLTAAFFIFFLMTTILFFNPPENRVKSVAKNGDWKQFFNRAIWNSLIIPLRQLIEKKAIFHTMGILILYKSADFFMQKMSRPFLMEIGFSKLEIARIVQLFGSIAVVVGGLAGGYFIKKIGTAKAMVYFGIFHALSFFSYMLLVKFGAFAPILYAITLFEAFSGGCVTTAFLAFLYGICKTGSSYALMWALHEIGGIFFMSVSGIIVDYVGWSRYFTFVPCLYIAIILLLFWRPKANLVFNGLLTK